MRNSFRLISLTMAAAVAVSTPAGAQHVSLVSAASFPFPSGPWPGESQSTVIPPGVNPSCPAGRVLATNDGRRPPNGVVVGRDLDGLPSAVVTSSFDSVAGFDFDPYVSKYLFGTNDHDLVRLGNGQVLYITGAFSRQTVQSWLGGLFSVKPIWFDDTWRKFNDPSVPNFGPGARYVVLTWRSTDCGSTFQFLSEFDPARSGYVECANPQFNYIPGTSSLDYDKPYDMGGSDGQLIAVDPATDRLYLTFPCVGYKIDSFGGLDYKLSTTKLDKTQLLVSDDKGVTWKPSGVFPTANWPPAWRRHLVPGSSNKVAVGIDRSFLLGTPNASGSYTFASPVAAAPNAGPWGFDDATFGKNPNNVGCAPGKSPCSVSTNMFGHTVIARVPASNQYVVTFPTTIAGKGHGFRMLFYDAGGQFVGEGNPVVPKSASLDNFVFHLAAVDHGSGPVLLYWSDVDSAAKTATVRGRFVTGPAAYTSDFQIAASFKNTLDGKKFVFARSFSVNTPYWYGDYRTASGFSWPVSPMLRPSLFIYYPSWVEPDASIRYTRVEYSVLGSAALRERDSEGTRVRMLAAKRAPDHGSSGKSAAGQTTQPASRASGPPETRRKTP